MTKFEVNQAVRIISNPDGNHKIGDVGIIKKVEPIETGYPRARVRYAYTVQVGTEEGGYSQREIELASKFRRTQSVEVVSKPGTGHYVGVRGVIQEIEADEQGTIWHMVLCGVYRAGYRENEIVAVYEPKVGDRCKIISAPLYSHNLGDIGEVVAVDGETFHSVNLKVGEVRVWYPPSSLAPVIFEPALGDFVEFEGEKVQVRARIEHMTRGLLYDVEVAQVTPDRLRPWVEKTVTVPLLGIVRVIENGQHGDLYALVRSGGNLMRFVHIKTGKQNNLKPGSMYWQASEIEFNENGCTFKLEDGKTFEISTIKLEYTGKTLLDFVKDF